ncbi:nucleotide-diphospho-sugar transferase [Polychytrium aggregatum]|uniref:nucleotide-diphospho-sugar transferase n=1 Tax=Polychytrium aggregatum TaxID=110093 RepID=UPI0022FE8330|nr:nucleotide-diphospho-sugar transferase [Polychytrium aggregatum]KAI9208401.1 nucleotide-diphospho-sugar transferase [Polychytrium aggregatum]
MGMFGVLRTRQKAPGQSQHLLLYIITFAAPIIAPIATLHHVGEAPLESLASCRLPGFDHPGRENACIIMLARNSDRSDVLRTLQTFDPTFNARYRYPYVFFNQEPFDTAFRDAVTNATQAVVYFELIPPEQWSIPPHYNQTAVLNSFKKQGQERPGLKAEFENYHHMCRYYSGYFATHHALKRFKYYWRIEPDVTYFCTLAYDPFALMRRWNKTYGFNVVGIEALWTVPTLWSTVLEYLSTRNRTYPEHLRAFDRKSGESPDVLSAFNYHYFFDNFEIADLDFFRSDEYQDYFRFLDDRGGFYFERWGDAAVHTLGVAMFLKPSQIHYFNDIGYRHGRHVHCPVDIPKYKVTFDNCNCRDLMPKTNPDAYLTDSWWDEALKHYLRLVPELDR